MNENERQLDFIKALAHIIKNKIDKKPLLDTNIQIVDIIPYINQQKIKIPFQIKIKNIQYDVLERLYIDDTDGDSLYGLSSFKDRTPVVNTSSEIRKQFNTKAEYFEFIRSEFRKEGNVRHIQHYSCLHNQLYYTKVWMNTMLKWINEEKKNKNNSKTVYERLDEYVEYYFRDRTVIE